VRRKCSAGPVVLPLWAGKARFGVVHSIKEFTSDTTQRLCTNHIVTFCSFFCVYFVCFSLDGGREWLGAGFGVLHATQLIGHAARLLYYINSSFIVDLAIGQYK